MNRTAARPEPRFWQMIGLRVLTREPGLFRAELDVGEEHLNPGGGAHGGIMATMIDSACASAGVVGPDGTAARSVVTLSLTVNYTGVAREGRLTVVGRVLSSGRKIFSAEAEVHHDDGTLIAHGVATLRYIHRAEEHVEGEKS
ncbi:PaaI family thioesterase [Paracoccus sp. S1E-3]|uniref:PaaI family thioesterase n=1 Tax=Paracoccus sp. S1E-3 TaxID=2756130 RepID=UPI0015EED137|nr:PaaI family thioesterase [Paracoccus sp. S1E-3]MBA4489609.1 PaaI family thioesterase [Paracoccus sp. S1E-3]